MQSSQLTAQRIRDEALDQIPWPEHHPLYVDALLGADQRLWLKRDVVGDSARWEIWSPDRGPEMEVWVPADLDLKYADDEQVWGVRKNSLDVPFLYRYLITAR